VYSDYLTHLKQQSMSENMIRNIRFVQVSLSLSKAVVQETQKLYDLGLRVGILCSSKSTLELIDHALWTQKQISFIPHATQNDADPSLQPIYLTVNSSFPNSAEVLLCVECPPVGTFAQEIIMFAPTSDALASIRQYYKSLNNSAHKVTFTKG
jgi:DNA polymerase III subunit chi